LKGSSGNYIDESKVTLCKKWGVWLEDSKNNLITNSNFHNNVWSGMFIEESTNCTIENSNFYNNNYDGFTSDYSKEIFLRKCTANDNSLTGLHFYKCNSITISDCRTQRNRQSGMILGSSNNCQASNVIIDNNKDVGFNIHYSQEIDITNSTVGNNKAGIHLINSSKVDLESVGITNNNNNGVELEESSNNILKNCNIQYNGNIGIFSSEGGFLKSGSKNNKYINCQVNNNTNGIYLLNSPKALLDELDIYNNSNGLILFKASNTTIRNSEVFTNLNGLRLWRTADCTITGCEVKNNNIGIFLGTDLIRNSVHHNTILDNTLNGGDSNPGNFWDDISGEGNYWSDYNGTDYDENGIGDQPHPVTNYSRDNYPLVDIKNTVLKVLSTEPLDDEILVSMNTYVNITFSEKMDKETVFGNITLTPKTEVLNYSWSDKDRRVSLELPKMLNGTTYYVEIPNTVIKSAWGKPLRYPYRFRFTTIDPYNFRRPKVVEHFPNSTNASISTNISITFNEPIHLPSLEDAISITPDINAEITLVNDIRIVIYPAENLSYKTTYLVSIGTKIVNLINRSMKFPYNFSFTTEPDRTPPYVVDHYPTGKVKVPVELRTITIIFSEPVDHITVQDRFETEPSITGNYTWMNDNRSFNFEISELLIYNQTYNITLETGFTDILNNPSPHSFNFSFGTVMGNKSNGKPDGTNDTDKIPPYVKEYFPTSKELIPVDIEYLIITFNEQVNRTSIEERFRISPLTMGNITWTNNNMTFQYHFSNELLFSTNYTIQLLPGYMDLVGNQNLEQFEFSFRTITGISPFQIIE
jgi:parallel beta-helix repeat protein